MESFKRERLSKSRPGCEVRFDRSGGKGGQNVNKVNTKATLKVNIDQASWIPSSLLSCLRDSPYYAASSNSLLITGSSYRTQSENLQDCFDKIQTHLLSLARPLSPKPTTTAQSQTVQKLIVAQKKRVRVEKDRRSEKKNERRSGKGRDYD
ncbi:Predicted peptidyl-tRNA hydrolase [Phaffia rhodozyma]|uniref:Predicted peptidyl-tRNA hydrolase n=1 Tax=Phaffia rhodozyma TaxID=264483 RepID=A0A0F7SRK6_PHARH|nr:Predicted peptidyl-tRNA hydrolase [Phaffia rhodozyma]